MLTDLATADQISRVISQATAPAFLLGAVAGFISVLITRMNRLADRSNAIIAISDDDSRWAHLKAVLPRLSRRAKLMNRAIEFALISGIFTTALVIVAFVSAFLKFQHEYGAGVMFVLALASFAASLITLWREVRAAQKDIEYYS
ncbi:MAG: DUF2721 domain-containing protein [Hyphomicrobiales bacterium]|nr:DUF2721 domain-containing protein [Hyphomicrobiales bacterium]MBW0005489.1 DUF2721 domain-containing protein [Hyphomicrobiales bacterium]